MGLQLPRHGIRRLPAGWSRARTLAVRAGRGRHGGQSQPDDLHGAEPRRDDSPPAAARGDFPQAKKHTQWPGTGRIGDKVFDDFDKTQVQFLAGTRQETLTRDANVALLDAIGTPVILLTHSQGGAFGWAIAERASEPGEGDRRASSPVGRRSRASTPRR